MTAPSPAPHKPPLSRTQKLVLDLIMGAAVPLAILSWGPDYIGNRPTFILAGLIPAAYVLWDVMFFTKKFNFITTVVAVTAVTQGSVALLTVDGWKYALADTSGSIVTFLIFGVSLALGKPIINYFVVQIFEAETPEEESLVWRMLSEPSVHRMMVLATLIILAENLLRGTGNFLLNYVRVTAEFDTKDFIEQKRNVDAITRIVIPITSIAAMMGAFIVVNKSIDHWIGAAGNDGGTLFDQIRKRLALDKAKAEPVTAAPDVK